MKSGIASNAEIELQLALEQLCDQQSPLSAVLMLHVLYNIHRRILDEPTVDKHFRIYTKGKIFYKYVWRWEGAKAYFVYTGWMTCGDFLILSKSQPVHMILKAIEDVFRKNKKVQLLYSGSVKPRDGRKSHSISDDSNLPEEEYLASYTNIEAPPERDSAIGSGMDDDDDLDIKAIDRSNNVLQQLQSQEHNVGDEAYIVVDFVTHNNSCMSEKSSQDITMGTPKRKTNSLDDSEIAVENSSPFTSVQLLTATENNFTYPARNDDEKEDEKEEKSTRSLKELAIEVNMEVGDEVEEDVEMTSEKCDDSKREEEEEEEEVVGVAKTGRKKLYSAGHGLKKSKPSAHKDDDDGDRAILNETQNGDIISNVADEREIGIASPTLHKNLNLSRSSSGRRSPFDETRHSPNLERTSSPSNLVRQNKLLFDQQIANELKTKYSNPQEIVIPRQSLGGANAFERGIIERQSSPKERGSITSRELDLTGIVAGARSLFEGDVKDSAGKSTSNTTMKDTENIKPVSVEKPIKRTSMEECESVIINSVPELASSAGKRKKKKFPFKKTKGNKRVELLGAKLIDANQPYDERAIDVETASVNDPPYKGSGSSDNVTCINAPQSLDKGAIDVDEITSVNDLPCKDEKCELLLSNDSNEQVSNLSERHDKADVGFIPVINTSVSTPTESDDGENEVVRSKSKRRRLCKARESISSHYEENENNSDSFLISNSVSSNVTVAHRNDVNSNEEEEMLTETLVTDVAMSNWSFDKLDQLQDGGAQHDENFQTEVFEDTIISLPNIEPIKIDIDALQNESSIDEEISPVDDALQNESSIDEEISPVDNPVINVSGPQNAELNFDDNREHSIAVDDDELNSTFDDMSYRSDLTGSFYDEDGASMNLSVYTDTSSNIIDDNRRKKKKRFPFHIKLGRKNKDKSKGELSPPPGDSHSGSSYKISKKNKKNKSVDNLDEIGHTLSTSSIDSISRQSSASSLPPSNPLKNKDKVKSKIPFFKKKKSKTTHDVSSPQLDGKTKDNNQVGSKSKLNVSRQGSTPSMSPSNEHRTNGHTNHRNGLPRDVLI